MYDTSRAETFSDDFASLFESAIEETLESNPWSYFLSEIESGLDGREQLTDFHGTTNLTSYVNDSVVIKIYKIWDLFRSIIDGVPNRSLSMIEVKKHFSCENLSRFLDLFWDRWYPHCPIIHRPTFEIGKCSPLLLLSMLLIGSITSSDSQEHLQASTFLDTVEELVFAHPIFGDTPDIVDKQGIPDHEIISILQATYFICIMQKWEGNENAKLRIQRSRFTDFVAVRMMLHSLCYDTRLITAH